MEARHSSKTDLVGKVLYIEDNPVNILVMDFSHLERELSTLLSRDAERRP